MVLVRLGWTCYRQKVADLVIGLGSGWVGGGLGYWVVLGFW